MTLMRRVAGYHDIRMDGISDLVLRARGATVLDVGCNRGLVGFEFANNGARLVHGCDLYEPGILTAREVFMDLRNVQSQFEVVDLTLGPSALDVFGTAPYDIVLLLAVIHKIARQVDETLLDSLVRRFAQLSLQFIGWRATQTDSNANTHERKMLDRVLGSEGFKRIQYSEISDLGPAAIWRRTN